MRGIIKVKLASNKIITKKTCGIERTRRDRIIMMDGKQWVKSLQNSNTGLRRISGRDTNSPLMSKGTPMRLITLSICSLQEYSYLTYLKLVINFRSLISTVYGRHDMAEGCLFSWLGEEVLKRPTIARFFSLLDNYNPNEGCKELVTYEERQEQAAFIEEISRTAPIKYLHNYLVAKGVVSENYQEFKRLMTSLWFDLYGRGGTSSSSSAFEHVFVGEIKQRGEQEVSGFHNLLQFYLEEAKGRVDYQGYIFPRRRGQVPDSETQLLTVQFEWNGVLKSVSSTLVGVSPEFEIALYTLCFFAGGEDNFIQLGPYPVNVKCYCLGNKIGSVFPIAEC